MSDDKKSAMLGPITKATMGISAGRALNASPGGIDELRRDIQMLMDIEAIRQIKHAYFRCIDTANFAELAEFFFEFFKAFAGRVGKCFGHKNLVVDLYNFLQLRL